MTLFGGYVDGYFVSKYNTVEISLETNDGSFTTLWLTEKDLEEMLKAIREAKENPDAT